MQVGRQLKMADNGFGVMLTHHSSLGVIVTMWQTQVIIQPKMEDNRFGAVLTYLILNDNTDSPGYGTKDTDDNDDTDMTNIESDGMPPPEALVLVENGDYIPERHLSVPGVVHPILQYKARKRKNTELHGVK